MKNCLFLFSLLFGVNFAFGQTDTNTVPIKWERYQAANKKVSLLLPKIPVHISTSDICAQLEIDEYAVYAKDVIYGLNIFSKSVLKVPEECPIRREFDKNSFIDRISKLQQSGEDTDQQKININGKFVKINAKPTTYWLFNDFKNNQWVELFVVNSDENSLEVKNFINSLKFGKKPTGIEIGQGALQILGDNLTQAENEELLEKLKADGKTRKVSFIIKPQPRYTDMARYNNIQGTVQLRITFLANGTVGSIYPTKGLPDGLTEQAIAAARKLVFLPASKNGTRYSVSKMVQYTFTIY